MVAAALLLAWVGPARCVAQAPAPPSAAPSPPARADADGRRGRPVRRRRTYRPTGCLAPKEPAGHRCEAADADAVAERRPVPDQPGDGVAALRRPAADRRRGAGQRLGRRGRPHPGQGPLAPHAQHRLRLHPPRRRRPGLQQGHLDRGQHELLLRRCRPDGTRPRGSSPRPMPSISPWWRGRSSTPGTGTSSRPRTTPCSGPPTPTSRCTSIGGCTPVRSTASSGGTSWSSGSPP